MTMVNLKRSNHNSLQNNLNSKSWDQHYYNRDRQEEDELLLPDMVESPSGSQETMSSGASNSPPPMYSSSSRMQERFSATLSKARNQRRRSRRQIDTMADSNAQLEPSNSSILKGADIIKRQLSKDDSPLRATHLSKEAPNSHRRMPSSSSELSHWDPWKVHSELSKNPTAKIEDLDLFKHEQKPARNTRKQEILSGGDDYFQVKRDGRSKSSSRNNNNTTRIRNNTVAPRVSDFDDSTFESSASGGNGYLPTQLLTCGGLNTTIADCNAPQQFLPAHLLQNNRCTTKSDEELETDTLDFLANLHCKEEDLNFAFGAFGTKSNSNKVKSTTPQEVSSSSHVTAASTPFETMLSSRSSLFDRLAQDPAYQHALKAGTVWQSLCSQHVRFPAHWWDSKQPIGPPLGSSQKRPWKYVGRHRVQGDAKLHRLIGNRSSSGRVILHLQVRDEMTGQIAEDICCGCYHPNARGIRTTQNYDPKMEDCRDVWIAHRRRATDFNTATNNDFSYMTTLESLLIHQNKGRVHQSPLGAQGGKHVINNQNLRMVFGSKPPCYTILCSESDLYELFQEKLDGSIPASVALLRHYLQFQMRN